MREAQHAGKKSLYYVAVPVLLGTPETSLSGLNTLIALSVRRSMRSSSSPTPAAAAAAAASSLLAEAARAAAGSSGVRMVMYLREWADRQCYVTLTQEGQDEQDTQVLGPKLFFVAGLVIFATAVARLVCPDLLG